MADKPIIYKKVSNPYTITNNSLTSDQQTKATNIIGQFITYFKAKHL